MYLPVLFFINREKSGYHALLHVIVVSKKYDHL